VNHLQITACNCSDLCHFINLGILSRWCPEQISLVLHGHFIRARVIFLLRRRTNHSGSLLLLVSAADSETCNTLVGWPRLSIQEMSLLCSVCCCGLRRAPPARRPLTDQDIEKLANVGPTAPPSSYQTRPPTPACPEISSPRFISSTYTGVAVNIQSIDHYSMHHALTPHTTGATLPSYYDMASTASVTGDSVRGDLVDLQQVDAKSRPQSMRSLARSDGNDKEHEAAEEREGERRGHHAESQVQVEGRRGQGDDAIVWDELDMPPPVYTPGDRQQW
jgi:hypothetical protein